MSEDVQDEDQKDRCLKVAQLCFNNDHPSSDWWESQAK